MKRRINHDDDDDRAQKPTSQKHTDFTWYNQAGTCTHTLDKCIQHRVPQKKKLHMHITRHRGLLYDISKSCSLPRKWRYVRLHRKKTNLDKYHTAYRKKNTHTHTYAYIPRCGTLVLRYLLVPEEVEVAWCPLCLEKLSGRPRLVRARGGGTGGAPRAPPPPPPPPPLPLLAVVSDPCNNNTKSNTSGVMAVQWVHQGEESGEGNRVSHVRQVCLQESKIA